MGNNLKKLSEDDIHFLQMHTNFNRSEIKEFHKEHLERNPDGLMDFKTFKDFMTRYFPNNAENFAQHYFRSIDKDKSGKIDFKEFLLYLSTEKSTNPFERISWLFQLFDIDDNGTIDRNEMTEIFKIALKMTDEDTEDESAAKKITDEIFTRYDKEKNNALTKFEFQDAILENPRMFADIPNLYQAMINKLD